MKTPIDYYFKAVNPTDYELTLTMLAKSSMLNLIFAKSKKQLEKKGVKFHGDPKNIEEFDIPPEYLGLARTALRKNLRNVEKQLKKDKIEIITINGAGGKFKRVGNDWEINIMYVGQYADKR